MKNKFTTIGIILITVLLAGVAIFTAIRLYQTRSTPVAPNVPSSKPAAAGTECGGFAGKLCPAGEICVYSGSIGVCQAANTQLACQLNFVVTVATPTPTASPSPSPTPTSSPSPTPSPSPVPLCNSACTSSSQCPSGLACYIPNGATAGNCRKSTCNSETDCVCATPTPTASPSPTSSPSPTPTATVTATPTATATVTASPNPLCNGTCTSNSNCPSGLMCYIASGATSGSCRNTQCLSETDCTCAITTTTPTTTPTYLAQVPTEEPTLPEVGTKWPTIFGAGFGILIIIGSLLLAL